MSHLIPNEASLSSLQPSSQLPTCIAHGFEALASPAEKERIATIAEQKLESVFAERKQEPSLRYVLLQVALIAQLSICT